MLHSSQSGHRNGTKARLSLIEMLISSSFKPSTRPSGFTLIEMLITIMITGIMAAIAIPSFLNWYNNKKIEDATARIEGALQIARSSAVKHNITCTVTISSQQISAAPTKCLPTGVRLLEGTNANIATDSTGSQTVTFSSKGTATLVADKSVIVIYDQDAPDSRKMKCITISNGVGLMRVGTYNASEPPSNEADVDDVEALCLAPS